MVKRHEFHKNDAWERLIVLVRSPMDAIVSHTRNASDHQFKDLVDRELGLWATHLVRYSS